MSRFYTAPNGERYPLTEAKYDMAFKIYKQHCRIAKKGDPQSCQLALGLLRHPDVLHVYVGSGGDAYIVFKGGRGESPYAVHFTIPIPTRRIIDAFDKGGKSKTQIIVLRRPTSRRTLDARREMNESWNARVKAGEHTVTPRGTQKDKRITRIGVAHRPRPRVTESGNVKTAQTTME